MPEARPRISEDTIEQLDEIIDEYGYNDYDAAIRHLLREVDNA